MQARGRLFLPKRFSSAVLRISSLRLGLLPRTPQANSLASSTKSFWASTPVELPTCTKP
jgi:hypothetical protein